MSFGAFGGRADVMAQFASALPHAGTFNNNVLSMAAGAVAMGEIFTAEAADTLFARGEAMRARLNEACAQARTPMHFTGLGSMVTPHFRTGPIRRPYRASPAEEGLCELFFFAMLEACIYLARRGMVALSLPISDSEIDRFITAVAEFVHDHAALLRKVT
jgi:glutamate-1-semialdehyde 2,1-aminomutase